MQYKCERKENKEAIQLNAKRPGKEEKQKRNVAHFKLNWQRVSYKGAKRPSKQFFVGANLKLIRLRNNFNFAFTLSKTRSEIVILQISVIKKIRVECLKRSLLHFVCFQGGVSDKTSNMYANGNGLHPMLSTRVRNMSLRTQLAEY